MRLTALAISAACALAACSGGTGQVPDSAGTTTVSVEHGDPASASPTGATAEPTDNPGDLTTVLHHDGSRVSGLSSSLISDQEALIHLAWPVVPGADDLTSALEESARAKETAYRADNAALLSSSDWEAHPEINSGWFFAGYSPEMIGVLEEGWIFEGASFAETWATTWWDPQTRQVIPSIELIESEHRDEFRSLVAEEVRTSYAASVLPEELDQVLSGPGPKVMAFTAKGDLVVGFDAYDVTAGHAGAPLVTIPKGAVDGLLSPSGRKAREAALEPADPALVPAEPTSTRKPTPEPTPEPTPAPEPVPAPTADPGTTAGPAPGRKVDCAQVACVAITYDDGPGGSTDAVLSAFEARGQRATFFVLGQQVQNHPDVLRRVAAGGHEIGVHTWDHQSLPRLAPDQVRRQLDSTVEAISAAGGGRPTTFRPPYGATDAGVQQAGRDAGLTQVLWDIDTLDWKDRDARTVTRRVLSQARRGAIILMHDIHPSTAEATPAIVDGLVQRGFTLVTVSELLASR